MTSGLTKRSYRIFRLGKLIYANVMPADDQRYARAMQARFFKDSDLRAQDWKEVGVLLSKYGEVV